MNRSNPNNLKYQLRLNKRLRSSGHISETQEKLYNAFARMSEITGSFLHIFDARLRAGGQSSLISLAHKAQSQKFPFGLQTAKKLRNQRQIFGIQGVKQADGEQSQKFGKKLNKLGLPNNIQILEGEDILKKIKNMNQNGQEVIFAPNHLIPSSVFRKNIGFAVDYFFLKKALNSFGINNLLVVSRGDGDIKIDNKISEKAYQLHRKILSFILSKRGDVYPISHNFEAPKEVAYQNIGPIKRLINSMNNGDCQDNLIIYPYGNWMNPGEQNFDTESAYDVRGNRFFHNAKDGKNVFHSGIKRGFVRIAELTSRPIAPIYCHEHEDGNFYVSVGDLIDIENKKIDNKKIKNTKQNIIENDLKGVNRYLDAMQQLKNKTMKRLKK